jgi:hypothetical protein
LGLIYLNQGHPILTDVWDLTDSLVQCPWPPAATSLVPMAKARRRQWRRRTGGPKAPGRAQGGQGECGKHERGHGVGAEAPEVSSPRRGGSAAAQPHSFEQSRATDRVEGKNRGWGGWLPRGEALRPLNGGRGKTRAQVDGNGAAATRRRDGERGQR